ncbi:MAG: helix-turn-helix domain-containing protein [Desulfobulbaceae bacterium]|nr:helix-turn-helix domain-containing protein [Desulfobulbaceae bacterium]
MITGTFASHSYAAARIEDFFPPKMLQDKTLRNEQIYIAHIRHGYTLKAIAEHLKIHYTTVSKIVRMP